MIMGPYSRVNNSILSAVFEELSGNLILPRKIHDLKRNISQQAKLTSKFQGSSHYYGNPFCPGETPVQFLIKENPANRMSDNSPQRQLAPDD